MLHTRTSNFFENALFDDRQTWKALSPDERESFTKRLNRGAVWESVTDLLSNASNISLVPGRARRVRRSATTASDLEVQYANATGVKTITAGLVVDATGFDPWGFTQLLPSKLRDAIKADIPKTAKAMNEDLSLKIGRLRAPACYRAVGEALHARICHQVRGRPDPHGAVAPEAAVGTAPERRHSGRIVRLAARDEKVARPSHSSRHYIRPDAHGFAAKLAKGLAAAQV